MSTECGPVRERIPRKLLGDLSQDEMQLLDSHLASCAECREEEQLYLRTFSRMRAAEDVPVPRHFFVYEPARRPSPWGVFRSMSLGWQGFTAAAALAAVLLAAFSVAGLRIRFEPGAMIVSLGAKPAAASISPLEMQAFEARVLQVSEQRNRKELMDWVRTLREEMTQGNRNLDQRQKILIETALTAVGNRMETRISDTVQALEASTTKSLGDLYTTVNLQRERDVTAFNERLSQVALNGETRSNQTDVILDALLQAAELRLRQ